MVVMEVVDSKRPSAARMGLLALVLGVTGFGGGFAVAQRLKRMLVDERRWVDEASFVEAFSVASALPGTAATNLLTILGMRIGGARAAALCTAAFLLPSVVLMILFGAFYDNVRSVGALSAFMDGMSFATVGVVGAVAIEMRKSAIRNRVGWILAISATALLTLQALNLLEVVLLAGAIGILVLRPLAPAPAPRKPDDDVFPPSSLRSFLPPLPLAFAFALPSAALFLVFARIGVATFGGGFAMITPIEHEVVTARGWLDEPAFNHAMVLGQITPGPVAIAATFIGYRVAGIAGALSATLGMFGPAFILSMVAARSLEAFRTSAIVQGFLLGVAPAVVGVIAAAAISLGRTTVQGGLAAAIMLATFGVLVRFPRLSPLIPLAIGGAVTLAARYV